MKVSATLLAILHYLPLSPFILLSDMYPLAIYLHNIDPVIVELFELGESTLALRWYGLAYLAGFLIGYLLLRQLSKANLYCIEPKNLGDFISNVAVFGVLMGGRLGELFFYWLPIHGWDGFLADPTWVFRVWEGGMASHGGILGGLIVAAIYAKRHKLSFLSITDGLAIVAPLGICFGRIANFINGELYGRICSADSIWAVKFPIEGYRLAATDPIAWSMMASRINRISGGTPQNVIIEAKENGAINAYQDWFIELSRTNNEVLSIMGEYLNPRYPSQLFEAVAEGALIFVVLIALRFIWKSAPAGTFIAIACLLYAAGRIYTEYFREPESLDWHGFTRGQYLSFGVILIGLLFLIPVIKELIQRRNLAKKA